MSKIINTINRFDSLTHTETLNKDEVFFIDNITLELAKDIIHDFGEISAKKLALILLGATVE